MLRVVDVRESHEEDDAEEENADKRSKPTEYCFFLKLAYMIKLLIKRNFSA